MVQINELLTNVFLKKKNSTIDITSFTTLNIQTDVSQIIKRQFKYSFMRWLKPTNHICKDSIRDDPKIILGTYVKRAQTISFAERGFERLGLGHWTVVWVGSG